MSILPTIDVRLDPEADAQAFNKFLTHDYYVWLRDAIQHTYPKLAQCLQNPEERESCVQREVLVLHEQHHTELSALTERSRALVSERGPHALELLARLMDWNWQNDTVYHAYVSLLPGSPFSVDSFWYSALQELSRNNPEKKNLLSVGIHEISHIIFLEQLRQMEIPIQRDAAYVFKEALTAALLGVPEMVDVLGIAGQPKGNYELHELRVSIDGAEMGIVEGMSKLMNSFRGNYTSLLKAAVARFFAQYLSWHSRMEIWRKYGRALSKDSELLAEYRVSIVI